MLERLKIVNTESTAKASLVTDNLPSLTLTELVDARILLEVEALG